MTARPTPQAEGGFELRPYQVEALHGIVQHLMTGEVAGVLVQAPTGAGKTVIGATMVAVWHEATEAALADGSPPGPDRALVIVPSLSLVGQWVDALDRLGYRSHLGVMQADHPRRNDAAPIQVATAQTLAARGMPAGVDLAIIDEAHVEFEHITRYLDHDDGPAYVGLSATPWSPTRRLFDAEVTVATTADLTDDGHLVGARYYAPAAIDTSGVRVERGEFATGQLAGAARAHENLAAAVRAYHDLGEGRPALIFAVDLQHAADLAQAFNAAGIATAMLQGATTREEREAIFDRFRRGELRALCGVGTLTTGLDLPLVSCLVIARPTMSDALWCQIVGRGLRPARGKVDCKVLDLAGNVRRLGFPIELEAAPRDARGRRTDRPGKPPIECRGCKALHPAGLRACPHCGFERPRPALATSQRQPRPAPASAAPPDVRLVEVAHNPAARRRHAQRQTYLQVLECCRELRALGQLTDPRGFAYHSWVEWLANRGEQPIERQEPGPYVKPAEDVRAFVHERLRRRKALMKPMK